MFIVLLKFSGNKGQAGQFMEGHNEWVKRGIQSQAVTCEVEYTDKFEEWWNKSI